MPYSGEKINRPVLIRLMDEHKLTVEAVATMLDRTPSTVQSWRSTSGADIPDHSLELLQYKIAAEA